MDEWNYLLNKNIKIIFEDGDNHFSKKEGMLIEVNSTHLILRVSGYEGDKYEGFNLSKVLRIEEVGV